MADEISNVLTPSTVVRKQEPQKITIVVDGSETVINIKCDEVLYLDGVEETRESRNLSLNACCSECGDNTVSITDPSTTNPVTISVNGIVEAIKQLTYDMYNS